MKATASAIKRYEGHVGPCDGEQCGERATRKVLIQVGTVQVIGYVCDTHAQELGITPKPVTA